MEKLSHGLILLEKAKCPWCKGRAGVSAFAQEDDPPCQICNGAGEIFTHMCQCGRASTRLRDDGTPYCGRTECVKLETTNTWPQSDYYSPHFGFKYHGFSDLS